MLEFLAYILARVIAGVLVALICTALLKNRRSAVVAGAVTAF